VNRRRYVYLAIAALTLFDLIRGSASGLQGGWTFPTVSFLVLRVALLASLAYLYFRSHNVYLPLGALTLVNIIYALAIGWEGGWTGPAVVFFVLRVGVLTVRAYQYLRSEEREQNSIDPPRPPTQPNGRPWIAGSPESEAYLRSLQPPAEPAWVGGTPEAQRYGKPGSSIGAGASTSADRGASERIGLP
jgi:hypothetical protein